MSKEIREIADYLAEKNTSFFFISRIRGSGQAKLKVIAGVPVFYALALTSVDIFGAFQMVSSLYFPHFGLVLYMD